MKYLIIVEEYLERKKTKVFDSVLDLKLFTKEEAESKLIEVKEEDKKYNWNNYSYTMLPIVE